MNEIDNKDITLWDYYAAHALSGYITKNGINKLESIITGEISRCVFAILDDRKKNMNKIVKCLGNETI